ncbi:MAG: TRAP transporter fused permease subunit [Chloroflexi bacterium]|nr:TRAP transporter fused permease subunit [Chloroflexota bacterium]
MREFKGIAAILVGAFYIGFVVWSLYGAVAPIDTYTFRMVHLGFIYLLAFLAYPLSPKAGRWGSALDIALAVIGVASIVYALFDLDHFIRRSTLPEVPDLIFGILVIALLIELSRRMVDMTFTLVLIGFLLYALFGNFIPGPLGHKGYDFDRIVGHMYMTLEGIFGVPISVSVSFVMLFVVYGVLMDAAGAGSFWLELALAVMGRKSSSAGRGAVVTTALLGGPQGSGVATTMSVTPIMWPILKKAGYSADLAAGLISAGGIGAVISPPLMGAAAFLIMQFLRVSFWDVVVMVTMPTLLYYLGSFFVVDLEAQKYHFAPPDSTGMTFWQVMRTKSYHLISLVLLVILLAFGLSPENCAIYAIACVVATSFLSKDRKDWLTPKRLIDATIEGAKNMLPVAVLLAAAGLIVGVFSLTGLGLKISQLIMSLSGGNVLLALVLALFTSFIVGLSLPITATYIMTVVMVAPALIKVGIPEHVAHLLAFYFAVLSEVSPPVGLSPSAAAAVTGGNPFASMMQAWKYSLPAFLVPFLFSATKEGASLLIVGATLPSFVMAVINSGFALFFLSLGIVGYYRAPLHLIERAALIAVAIWMVVDQFDLTPIGILPIVFGALVAGRHYWFNRHVPVT